ncbi:MAG TPA: VTT domain-containing protein [Acidobacteriaceae bacterium]|jgi:membrane protein DedA with SNARE-associated domain|nr:VTT domain-containing protein [Acidobacteriaceae bacterium]
MTFLAAAELPAFRPIAEAFADALPAASHNHASTLLHLLLSFGLIGVLLVSVVDSSFVPLPIPGLTDLMIVVLAAQHINLFLLVSAATLGSFLGGAISYQVGHAGGMSFLQKHVPPRILKQVCNWMQTHAILSVALPAILPPPMPLSPFVLAAGALKMSRQKFLATFTLSRLLRHAAAAALGVYFGPHVLRFWNHFTRKWEAPILISIWSIILLSIALGFWKLYKRSRTLTVSRESPRAVAPNQA